MKKLYALVAALAVTFLGHVGLAAAQDTGTAPLEVFGRMPAMESVQLSPDGSRLAHIAVVGEERSLLIHELDGMAVIGGVRAGDTKVRGLDWIGSDRVLLTTTATQSGAALGIRRQELADAQIYHIPTREVRNLLTGLDGGFFTKLTGSTIIRGTGDDAAVYTRVVPLRPPARAYLYRIDPETGRGQQVEDGEPDTGGYVLNAAGEAVARTRYEVRSSTWSLQAKRGGFWRTVWETTAPIDTPSLAGLGRTEQTVVIYAAPEDGEAGLYEVDLESGSWTSLPFAFDPDFTVSHPTSGLLAGAGVITDEGQDYEFLDARMAVIWRAIDNAYPGLVVTLRSWSDDLSRIVIFTNGSGDSGTYHLIDLEAGSAQVIGYAYPDLNADLVGDVRVVRYEASDGMEIPGYLTLPPGVTEPRGLPLVVLPHGGPAARDVMGFDWWAQGLASRGYAVLQPNFRGSAGLGDDHLEAGYGEWGLRMQTDLSDGVRHLAAEGIIDPQRVCIVGASYGGYAALAGPTLDPGVYRCAVSVAGVSDLRTMVQWSASQAGRRDSPVVRYWNRFMGAERLGDRSLDDRSPAFRAAEADAPILLLHGWDDTVVPYDQSRIMAEALEQAGRPYELIRLDGEDHWLSRAETRQRMLNETVRFLETHNPAR